MARRELDRRCPVRTCARSPGAERERLERAEVEARRRRRARGPAGRRRGSSRRTGSFTPARRRWHGEAGEALGDVRGHARLDAHAVGRVRALEVAGELVQLGEPPALGVGQQQLDRLHPRARTRPRSARAGGRAPCPRAAETSTRVGMQAPQLRAALGVDQVGLVEHEQARRSRRRRSPRARSRRRASISSSSSSSALASTTCRIRSASRVSSSVAPNASTSWCGSLRMKPTVSVTQERAAVEAHRARRRVERVEEPVLHADVGAGERVQQRRLAGVRVAGERDLAAGPARSRSARITSREPLTCASVRLSAAIRSRARRRSVSICVSPGPRVPTPPTPSRSRCVHSPRMRAMLYSSCASSTWSLPSALCAWPGEDVEDQRGAVEDRQLELLLEVALLARRQLVVADDRRWRRRPSRRPSPPRACRARDTCSDAASRGAARSGRRRRRRRCAAARCSSERSSPSSQRGDAEGALLGAARAARRPGGASRWCVRGDCVPASTSESRWWAGRGRRAAVCRASVPRVTDALAARLAARTLELIDVPSRVARARRRSPRTSWSSCARPASRCATRGDTCVLAGVDASAASARSSCSPGTSTRSPRRATSRAGSRTASSTGSARST